MRTPCFILILALLGLAHSFSLPKRPAHSFSPFSSARSYLFPDLKGYPTDIMLNILYGGTYESMQVFVLYRLFSLFSTISRVQPGLSMPTFVTTMRGGETQSRMWRYSSSIQCTTTAKQLECCWIWMIIRAQCGIRKIQRWGLSSFGNREAMIKVCSS